MVRRDKGEMPETPELPAWKAFVVQFRRDDSDGSGFSGRVEHLSSGRRAHFQSPEQLVDALGRLLAELRERP